MLFPTSLSTLRAKLANETFLVIGATSAGGWELLQQLLVASCNASSCSRVLAWDDPTLRSDQAIAFARAQALTRALGDRFVEHDAAAFGPSCLLDSILQASFVIVARDTLQLPAGDQYLMDALRCSRSRNRHMFPTWVLLDDECAPPPWHNDSDASLGASTLYSLFNLRVSFPCQTSWGLL